jgi:hypothetical protein
MCDGSIHAADLYLVHRDRRDPTREAYSCMLCATYFEISMLTGPGLRRYRKATPEEIAVVREEIRQHLEDLKSAGIRPIVEYS